MKKRSNEENKEREVMNNFLNDFQKITIANYCKTLGISRTNVYRNKTKLSDLKRLTNLMIIDTLQLLYSYQVEKSFLDYGNETDSL